MKKQAICTVLAALLIILPVEQVLAQAVQQEAVSVQQTEPSDGAASLFHVPPLTGNAARLLRTSSDGALLNTPFAERSLSDRDAVPGWSDWSNGKRVLVVIGVTVAAAVALVVLVAYACDQPGANCFSL